MSHSEASAILGATALITDDPETTKKIGAVIGASAGELEETLRLLGQTGHDEDRPDANTAPALRQPQEDAKSAKKTTADSATKSNGHTAKPATSTAARSATTGAAKNLWGDYVGRDEIMSDPAKFGLFLEDIDEAKMLTFRDIVCDVANLAQAPRLAMEGEPKPAQPPSTAVAAAAAESSDASAKKKSTTSAAAAAKKKKYDEIKRNIESSGWTLDETKKKMTLRLRIYHSDRLGFIIPDMYLVDLIDATQLGLRTPVTGSLPMPIPPPHYMGKNDPRVFYSLAMVALTLQSPPDMPTMWIRAGHTQILNQLRTIISRQPSFNALAKKKKAELAAKAAAPAASAAVASTSAAAATPVASAASTSTAAAAASTSTAAAASTSTAAAAPVASAASTSAAAAAPVASAASSSSAAAPARTKKKRVISELSDEEPVSGQFDHVSERFAAEEEAHKRRKRPITLASWNDVGGIVTDARPAAVEASDLATASFVPPTPPPPPPSDEPVIEM